MLADWFLFHAVPDVYHRRLDRLVRAKLASGLHPEWTQALTLPGKPSLQDSFLSEIQEYFGIPREEARKRMDRGAESFAGHFAEHAHHSADEAELEAIYDGTDLEVFELAEWHARRFEEGPHNYVLALRAAKEAGARSFLDYGSGIGSGAILFARHGFEVTLADVSSPLLDFARWRLEKRGLTCRTVHLRKENLGDAQWDVITLLDVLEHVRDPVGLVASLRDHLSPDHGQMIIRAPFDDPRPQHFPHDLRTTSRFGAVGYEYAWDRMGRNGLPIVLRVSRRGRLIRWTAWLRDGRLLGGIGAALDAARTLRLKLQKSIKGV